MIIDISDYTGLQVQLPDFRRHLRRGQVRSQYVIRAEQISGNHEAKPGSCGIHGEQRQKIPAVYNMDFLNSSGLFQDR